MNTKSQVPIRILFGEESFSNAIENKNVEEATNIIREACYDFHFDGIFDTPLFEELKKIDPDMPEKVMEMTTEEFEKNTKKLAEIIVESGFAPFSEKDIDIRPLLSAIRDQSWDVACFYYCIRGPIDRHYRYDHHEFTGLSEDEVEFFKLVRKGDTDAMGAMIKKEINPNVSTEDRTTALMVAVEYGHHDAAEILLKYGADIHAPETVDAESAGKGATAMNLAALNKDYQMMELLLENCGDINEKAGFDGESPFLIAVNSGDYDYMDFLLKRGADINIDLYNGKTGLIHAVLSNDKELANYLLKKGANVDHRNITGLTALEVAKDEGITEMEEFLIQAGAKDDHHMLEHLVTYCQDLYVWDNDIAYAYYHWTSDDCFSHFLIYGIGYLNKKLYLSDLRRFYIRKKDDELLETYAGDDHHWFHYVFSKNGEVVDEKFNKCSHGFWGNLICPDNSKDFADADAFEPENSEQLDFQNKYGKLSDFFRKFVSFVEEHGDSGSSDENKGYIFTRYSKNGWNFLGPHWERRSVNVKDEHEKLIADLLLQYFVY